MTIRSALVCLFLGLSASACGSGGGPLNATDFGNKYKFSDNEVPGWTQTPLATDPTGYQVYTGVDQLIARIDGQADSYKGCRVAMYQDLTGPFPEICSPLLAIDFDTAAEATAMFNTQEGLSYTITGYGASDVGVSGGLTGATAFAHFKTLYVELGLSGFGDQTLTCDAACPVAKQLLDVLKQKSN